MRKMVKPPIVCEHCGTTLKHGAEERFCDYCKGKIPEEYHLRVNTFWEDLGSSAQDNEFCSWRCVTAWLREFPYNKKRVSFLTLPYIGGSGVEFETELVLFFRSFDTTARDK